MGRPLIFLTIIVSATFSCVPESERYGDVPVSLLFSRDTILFDTVFTSIGSITKRLKVYNPGNNAVLLSRVRLVGGIGSPYNVIVNGREGPYLEDITLLGKDSLQILVSVTIDPSDVNLPYIVKDSLVFVNGNVQQEVKLVAWGQDAHFLSDSILSCNTLWEADRPYVLYNSILVDSLCTLTIGPGVQVFSHPGSAIFIKGTLQVNGVSDQRVLFTNDRKDAFYKDAPGQWEGIYFLEGSVSNHLRFTDIRNGVLGIRLGAPDNDTIPDVVISETRIENMSEYGILTFTSDLSATNTLVNSCRLGCVGNFAGGNYNYMHCTFSNFPVNFSVEGPSVVFSDNLVLSDNSVLEDDLHVTLVNSIVWGTLTDEVSLSANGNRIYTLVMNNNILKTGDTSLDIGNNLLNEDPLFVNPSLYDYHTDTNSPAHDAGLDQGLPFDLEGNPRDNTPDIGAFEKL